MKKILISSLMIIILSSCIWGGKKETANVENNIPTKTADVIEPDNNNEVKVYDEEIIPSENDIAQDINIDSVELKVENIKNNISEEVFNKINNSLKEQPFKKILEDWTNWVHYSQDNIEWKSTRSLWIKNWIVYKFSEYNNEYDD